MKATRTCSIEGCGAVHYGRTFCNRHWGRAKRAGMLPPKVTTEERFWAKVEIGDCWQWIASVNHAGYGTFGVGRQSVLAHRYAYELLVGPIPDGLQLDHLCRNRGCVNPDHLEPVTCRENSRRGFGVAGLSARRTTCINGHDLTGDNGRARLSGGRVCRTCARVAKQRYHCKRQKEGPHGTR